MVGKSSDVPYWRESANGKRTVWQLQGKIGRHPMPKQMATLWLCMIHPQTHGTMFQWCKKLLWLHSTHCCSTVLMSTRSSQNGCPEHGIHDSQDATSCAIHVRWFKHLTRANTKNWADHRYWSGQQHSPHIWAVVSTPLFQILTQEGFLAHIMCALSKQRSSMAGFGFIDNVDLCITDTSRQSYFNGFPSMSWPNFCMVNVIL